ncbi:MAG TPA: hypothetical protein VFU43_11035 [Streptosporangiaceae bacterium]|nr:hypothetical protein [Streptosporangiaceae bacterium]
MTDLLQADVVTFYDDKMCAANGEPLAVVATRGIGRTRTMLREIYRWTSYRRRGLRHLAHHFAVLTPAGEPLFQIEKLRDRAFRRVRIWVYGPEGLPLGRVERIRNIPLVGGLRLVGDDGSVLGTLRRGVTFDAVGLDGAGRRLARLRYGYHHDRMVGEVTFTEAPAPFRVLVLGYAAVVYLTR